jgi:tetratricopeptide (TPR) repeat protein
MHEFRYRAFLCYSHRDSAWAEWLHHALETFPIPPRLVGIETGAGAIPKKLAPVFRDRDELPSATNLSAKVSDALAQSANLVVICSPHAAQSHWVDEEVRTFQRLGRGDRIFCLIVDGEPGASRWAGREHDECFPAALTQRADAADSETGERLDPIAADARPGMDGKANARTKLVAGLLGVDLDDLKHRERRRRRWKMTAAITTGFALLCLTTTLAVNAVIARHAAERRQKQAEDLVGFMLGDLDDKLREVNRLDILESVADKVVRYFAALPPADVSDDTLAQAVRAQLKLGAVRRDEGHVGEALETFRGALKTSERLVASAPANDDFLSINAESLNWIGFIDWSQGRLDDALAGFIRARELLTRIGAGQPQDPQIVDRIASARTNAGRVYEARGDLQGARTEYVAVLDAYSALSRREAGVLQWRTEVGYAHNNLAQLALKEGKLEEAVREYVADRDIKANLFELDPTNNARREDTVASEGFLGRVLYLCGETAAAKTHLRVAMDHVEALLQIDPGATDWLEKAGSYGWMYGEVARASGDAAVAAKQDASAIARLELLVRKDATNVGWQRKLALAQLEEGRRRLALGQTSGADEAATAADGALAHAGSADDLANEALRADIGTLRGDAAAAHGDAAAARKHWEGARAAIVSQAAATRMPTVLDVWIGLRVRLADEGAAAAALTLLDSGYRAPDFVSVLESRQMVVPDKADVSGRIARLASLSTEKAVRSE